MQQVKIMAEPESRDYQSELAQDIAQGLNDHIVDIVAKSLEKHQSWVLKEKEAILKEKEAALREKETKSNTCHPCLCFSYLT